MYNLTSGGVISSRFLQKVGDAFTQYLDYNLLPTVYGSYVGYAIETAESPKCAILHRDVYNVACERIEQGEFRRHVTWEEFVKKENLVELYQDIEDVIARTFSFYA